MFTIRAAKRDAINVSLYKYILAILLSGCSFMAFADGKATAEKLQEGFISSIEDTNPKALVQAQQANIKKYASWLDPGMAPGKIQVNTYIPGKGLTVVYQGVEKGTITDKDFIKMYFTNYFGEDADSKMRDGYSGK